ncbi:putative porin [Bisgaardia hudsonensis]|uniref:Putative porin n=1 Tax=Bisgaardia hudsonensis TaxID=109472 RepID=A0A4R2N2K7_9PAST|nr:porin [Bisgaardia hudsonensis]QLB12564.1 hypothetical protein A6A11_02565 [Bisgaardia hudsonensis]TCP14106.1 putative porin [Bisgaardia hudsonensis]
MKKTLVALAVAAVAATSANAAVVYNQDGTKVDVGGSLRLVLEKETDKRADLNDNGSRVKVKGTHDLGEGLSALGYVELGFKGDFGSEGVTTRRLYAGFEHADIGTLTFGKQLTNADNFGVADPTYKFGGLWTGHFHDAGNKVIHFASKKYSGFSFGADYVFGKADKKDVYGNKVAKNDAYILGAFYDNTYDNGVNVKAELGYTYSNVAANEKSKALKAALGAGYNGFFLGVDYAQTKVTKKEKNKGFQVGASYQVTDMAKLYSAYRQTEQAKVKTKEFALGVGYKLHKQVETFVEYNTSKLKDAKRNNKVYAGLRVHF